MKRRKIEPLVIQPEPGYECPECSKKFLRDEGGGRYGTLCPDCVSVFAQKFTDHAGLCPECDEVIDLEQL